MATILILDDDAFARGFLATALTAGGHAVVLASGVDEGLRLWAERRREGFDVLAMAKDVGAYITLRKPVPAPVLVDAVGTLLTEPS